MHILLQILKNIDLDLVTQAAQSIFIALGKTPQNKKIFEERNIYE